MLSTRSAPRNFKEENWDEFTLALQGRLTRDGAIVESAVDKEFYTGSLGAERGKLKNLHCKKPSLGTGCWRHTRLGKGLVGTVVICKVWRSTIAL
jgi:hypothetical protein